MGSRSSSGFRELPHTADWALEIWAPDLTGLFQEAARGMYSLTGTVLQESPGRRPEEFQVRGTDGESLLVAFLSELLYIAEQDGNGFEDLHLEIHENSAGEGLGLTAAGTAKRIIHQSKEIKAVTYHQLQIRQTKHHYEVTLVFDV
jgi:SHS2 domain-containing protein